MVQIHISSTLSSQVDLSSDSNNYFKRREGSGNRGLNRTYVTLIPIGSLVPTEISLMTSIHRDKIKLNGNCISSLLSWT